MSKRLASREGARHIAGVRVAHPETWTDEADPRVHYRLSAKARRVSLRVRLADRRVEVVVPGPRAVREAEAFVAKQREWIDVQLEGLPAAQPFRPGAEITVRGVSYRLAQPSGRGRPAIDHEKRRVLVPAPAGEFANRTRRLLVREAREALEAATHHYAELLDRRVAKVSVRDTASRWGSSVTRESGTHISYSWRLVCAPPFVLDYVAAHEVAHILQPNHSPAFWAVVDGIFDRTKEAKRWLKRNGARLHAVGAEH